VVSWFYNLLKPQYGRSPLKDRVSNFFVLGLRKVLITLGFRFVWCDHVRGRPIRLTFDDDFSINLRLYPDYGYNLARICSTCLEKYPDLAFIDIGSAIGDSITQIRLYGKFPILAINPSVIGIKRNFGDCPDITIVDAFVSGRTSSNAQVPATKHKEIPILALAAILDKNPNFKKARIIKVDTDGIDCAILRDNETLLRENKPIVFFEYDPRFALSYNDEILGIFPYLNGLGYETAMIYNSNGVFLLSAQLAAQNTWEEIHYSLLRYNPVSYFDICVFSYTDSDIYLKTRNLELKQINIE